MKLERYEELVEQALLDSDEGLNALAKLMACGDLEPFEFEDGEHSGAVTYSEDDLGNREVLCNCDYQGPHKRCEHVRRLLKALADDCTRPFATTYWARETLKLYFDTEGTK